MKATNLLFVPVHCCACGCHTSLLRNDKLKVQCLLGAQTVLCGEGDGTQLCAVCDTAALASEIMLQESCGCQQVHSLKQTMQ